MREAPDTRHDVARRLPRFAPRPIARYCALLKDVPANVRHIRLHDSHYTYRRDDEVPLLTPELVRAVALAGRPAERSSASTTSSGRV